MASSSSSLALVYDGSYHPHVIAYETLLAHSSERAFERPTEGINTVGGFLTLDGQRVFVKFLPRDDACRAALVDSCKQFFEEVPATGCCVIRVQMPANGGAELPHAKATGKTLCKTGVQHALISLVPAGALSVTQYLISLSGRPRSEFCSEQGRLFKPKVEALLDSQRDETLLWRMRNTLVYRLVFGVGDMGLPNFLYHPSNKVVYSIDEGSAFSERLHPRHGAHKPLLNSNLLCARYKSLALAQMMESFELWHCSVPTAALLRPRFIALAQRYPTFSTTANKAAALFDSYVALNLQTAHWDIGALLAGGTWTPHPMYAVYPLTGKQPHLDARPDAATAKKGEKRAYNHEE